MAAAPGVLHSAAISGAREREQAALADAAGHRADLVAYIRDALDSGALTVIDVAAVIGVTRKAVYKMLG